MHVEVSKNTENSGYFITLSAVKGSCSRGLSLCYIGQSMKSIDFVFGSSADKPTSGEDLLLSSVLILFQ